MYLLGHISDWVLLTVLHLNIKERRNNYGKKASAANSQIIRIATILSDDVWDSYTEYGSFCGRQDDN